MPENLLPDKAYALASRLTLIPGFPNREQAIQAVAEWLLETCANLGQAQWLISETLSDPGWTGIDGMRTRFDARFRPRPEHTMFRSMGPIPAPVCGKCNDMGISGQPYEWFACEAGQALRRELPGYLDLCQSRDKREAAPTVIRRPRPDPPTEEEIDEIKAQQQAARTGRPA